MNSKTKLAGKFFLIVTAAVFAALAATSQSRADVVATVEVANGTTNSPGFIQWTLNHPDAQATYFEIEISPGMNANNIVTSMDFEVDNTFGFEGIAAGNVLTIEDVVGNLATSPGEIDIEWVVTVPPGGGVTPLNVPLTAAPRPGDAPSLSLFLAGPTGQPVQPVVGLIVVFAVEIETIDAVFVEYLLLLEAFPGESSSSMNQRLDDQLQGLNFPSGIQYAGLNNGFPTFEAPAGFKRVSVRSSARAINGVDTSGMHVGYILQPPLLMGDINCDGVVNLLDVAPFVDLLTSGGFSDKADFNGDGVVNLLDVSGFVEALTNS